MNSPNTKRLLALIAFAVIAFGCRQKEEQQTPPAAPKLKVVTTVAPITSIVENIAGDKAEVAGIIPKGSTPTPSSQFRRIANC